MQINRLYKIGILFLYIGISVISVAQTVESSAIEAAHEEFRNKMPSLEALIDSTCKNSPIIRSQQANIDINELRLKITKNEWIKNISIESSYQYGMFGNILTNPGAVDPLANSVLTNEKQSRYSAGLSVKIPISEMLSRKHEIKIGDELVGQTKIEKEKLIEELRKLVIIQYNDLMLKHKVFLIMNNNLQSQNVQLMMTEKEFLNNKVSIMELARIREMQSKSEIEFETAKSAFNTSFQLLQEITGVNFNL